MHTEVLLTSVTSTCIKYSSEGQNKTMYHSATPSLAAKALCSSVVPWARWEEGKLWSARVRSVFAFPLVSRPGGRHWQQPFTNGARITCFPDLNRQGSRNISDSRMRAHCSESPSPSRLFSTTAQNVPTGRAAPVTHDHLPRCSILFKVSPITSSGDAVGRSGDYRMPIRSGSITICRMIGRPFSTTRGACRDLRFSRICQIGCQRFSFRC